MTLSVSGSPAVCEVAAMVTPAMRPCSDRQNVDPVTLGIEVAKSVVDLHA
ncbi:MAG: hypothetical protein JWQ81_6129 [Amycolatopsis sp.]|nr:hypothetical protein [Amycolatopsis sp.]